MASYTVNICGIPHEVNEYKDAFASAADHFGEIDYKYCNISLADDLKPKIAEETLCHEMLHGIFFHMGRMDMAEDENLIDALANALIQSFEIKKYKNEKDMLINKRLEEKQQA